MIIVMTTLGMTSSDLNSQAQGTHMNAMALSAPRFAIRPTNSTFSTSMMEEERTQDGLYVDLQKTEKLSSTGASV